MLTLLLMGLGLTAMAIAAARYPGSAYGDECTAARGLDL